MLLKGFSIKFTVIVFSGFLVHVACDDSRRQCFDVESRTICYFMPNASTVDWDTAWKTCKELDATLPVILNEKGQAVLGDFLSERFPGQSVWTAGRYVGSNNEWRWLNGQSLSGIERPSCPRNIYTCDYETQAVLAKQLKYGARYPNNSYAFVCNFPGVNCTTEPHNFITWKGGCLHWTTNYRLPLNKARNECLKAGGDLATFSDNEDLDHLQSVSTLLKDFDDNGYWIGLHRKWWIWNTTDVHDIKYNLLDEYGNLGKDCLFVNEHSKWSPDKCSVNKSVICQTEIRKLISTDAPSTAFNGIVFGVVFGSVLLLFVLISVIIIIGRNIRNTRTKADVQADTDKTYEDLHNPGMADIPIAGVDNGFYTELVPTQQGRNVNHHNEPLYEDL